MSCHQFLAFEYLHHPLTDIDIQFLVYVLLRDRVITTAQGHMAVSMYFGGLDLTQIKGALR